MQISRGSGVADEKLLQDVNLEGFFYGVDRNRIQSVPNPRRAANHPRCGQPLSACLPEPPTGGQREPACPEPADRCGHSGPVQGGEKLVHQQPHRQGSSPRWCDTRHDRHHEAPIRRPGASHRQAFRRFRDADSPGGNRRFHFRGKKSGQPEECQPRGH